MMKFPKVVSGHYDVISQNGRKIGYITRIKSHKWLFSGFYEFMSDWGKERYEREYTCDTLERGKQMARHLFSGVDIN